MAFYDKYIPKELKKGADELLDFGSSVIEKGITKPFASISDKLIPNELRFLAPYAAGIGTLMLPPGMNMMTRALLASIMNAGGQIAADESATGELSDLNKLSMAIAGGLGALGSKDITTGPDAGSATGAGTGIREGIEGGLPKGMSPGESMARFGTPDGPSVGFMQGAENVGREGIGSLSDYVQGTRSTLADIGKNPGSLFQKNVPGRKNILGMKKSFPVLQDAAAALGPTAALATGDVAYEAAIDAANEFDRIQREEMEQAGMDQDAIANARRAAIREAMEVNNFSEEEILDVFEEIGLKDGGIASLKDGGMLNFGGRINFSNGGSGMMGIAGPEVVSKMGDEIEKGVSSLTDLITDSEGNVYTVLQYIRKFGEDAFFGGQKNPELPEKFYNKLGDEYIEEMKKVKERGYKDGGMLDFGGREMDLRGGGFVPIGKKERADDVPARLSKNEFVMTADAVRAAGGGSVNKGAQRMYDIMNRLEARA